MDNRLPYYMAYPLPLQYDDDRTERRDLEYMKSLYPDVAKRLLPYVEDEFDRLEYDGSMIYDEYPDKLQMRLLCARIYNQAEKDGAASGYAAYEPEDAIEAMAHIRKQGNDNWLRELIEVMVYQELFRRRSDRRRQRRRYY